MYYILHANFSAVCVTEAEVIGNRTFNLQGSGDVLACSFTSRKYALPRFCSYDLDLDLMTFIQERDPYPLKMYAQTKNELSTTRTAKVIVLQTDLETDRRHKNISTLFHGW